MHLLRVGVCLFGFGILVRLPTSSEPTRAVARVECDSLVRTRASDPLRYRQRGDRCEGVYGENVSGSSVLRVASLVESFETVDDSSSLPWRIEWTPPSDAAVVLRASPMRAGLYYRMETTRPIATTHYAWPSDVRRPLRIGRADIGLTGSTTMPLGSTRQEVLVPLRVSQRRPPARSPSYRLTLLPSVGLTEVYVTVASTNADGTPARYFQRDEKLGYGFYPAERAIDVRLPPLAERGVYFVGISATREASGGATRNFLLYHAGAAPVSPP
jgi:hypothetical protein